MVIFVKIRVFRYGVSTRESSLALDCADSTAATESNSRANLSHYGGTNKSHPNFQQAVGCARRQIWSACCGNLWSTALLPGRLSLHATGSLFIYIATATFASTGPVLLSCYLVVPCPAILWGLNLPQAVQINCTQSALSESYTANRRDASVNGRFEKDVMTMGPNGIISPSQVDEFRGPQLPSIYSLEEFEMQGVIGRVSSWSPVNERL